MSKKIEFALDRAAKKKGGDRYSANISSEDDMWIVYFPQSISRVGGVPRDTITVVIEEEE